MDRKCSEPAGTRGRRSAMLLGLLAVLSAVGFAGLLRADPQEALAPVVVLRGTLALSGTTALQYVADETNLDTVSIAGVTEKELLSLDGNELALQADFYRQAQLASGTGVAALKPLYIVIDPQGTWAYAQPWGTFTYVKDGRTVGPVTSPFLLLGEKMDHKGQAVETTPETSAANRKIVELTRAWYQKVTASRSGPPGAIAVDFDHAVLDRLQVSLDGGPQRGLSQLTGELSNATFLSYVERAVEDALDEQDLDGAALFAAFSKDAGLQQIADQGAKAALEREVAETVAHELGHVIEFAAMGLYNYKSPPTSLQMDGTSHTLRTLSNPEFAFVEGWGEANSMVVVGLPEEGTPGEANRIDYGSTVDVVNRKINDREAQIVSGEAHALKLLGADQPLMIPSLGTAPDEFLKQLQASATKAGMRDMDWTSATGQMNTDPDLVKLKSIKTYVDGLQARKGQPRGRYDFLRSEYAIAHALAELRDVLGLDRTQLVLRTLAKDNPRTFAELVEDFVHENPALKIQVYQTLADSTAGILVTQRQVDAVKAMDAKGQSVEIDIDQDGHVPGVSANAADPADFPSDMPPAGQDPLDPTAGGLGPAAPTSIAALPAAPVTTARAGNAADAADQHPPSLTVHQVRVKIVSPVRPLRPRTRTGDTGAPPGISTPDMSGIEKPR